MGKCRLCSCQSYGAPNIIQAGIQKITGGAALGCTNCGHHVNYHDWY